MDLLLKPSPQLNPKSQIVGGDLLPGGFRARAWRITVGDRRGPSGHRLAMLRRGPVRDPLAILVVVSKVRAQILMNLNKT